MIYITRHAKGRSELIDRRRGLEAAGHAPGRGEDAGSAPG